MNKIIQVNIKVTKKGTISRVTKERNEEKRHKMRRGRNRIAVLAANIFR